MRKHIHKIAPTRQATHSPVGANNKNKSNITDLDVRLLCSHVGQPHFGYPHRGIERVFWGLWEGVSGGYQGVSGGICIILLSDTLLLKSLVA